MAKKKEPEAKNPGVLAWVYVDGIKDVEGNIVSPPNYAQIPKIVKGTQPGDTDALHLKYYTPKRAYKTRVMKADAEIESSVTG